LPGNAATPQQQQRADLTSSKGGTPLIVNSSRASFSDQLQWLKDGLPRYRMFARCKKNIVLCGGSICLCFARRKFPSRLFCALFFSIVAAAITTTGVV
jgi:hypothetical protein